ncbi:MAG: hypothetical protein ABTQ34_09890 [Bdellovibrionales bacterium]
MALLAALARQGLRGLPLMRVPLLLSLVGLLFRAVVRGVGLQVGLFCFLEVAAALLAALARQGSRGLQQMRVSLSLVGLLFRAAVRGAWFQVGLF